MFFKNEEQQLLEQLKSLSERLAEDRIYEKALEEMEQDRLDPVAKARAFEEAEGDGQKARALYIKHRVRRIRDLAAEYDVWLQQESARKQETKKQEQAQVTYRKRLSNQVKNGKMPPKEILDAYREDFNQFYSEWVTQDYARKYLPKPSAWQAFLAKANLID